jgi:hypothetical protein
MFALRSCGLVLYDGHFGIYFGACNGITIYFQMVSGAEPLIPHLPTESFELHVTQMSFACFVSAVERHCSLLCVIVSLGQDLLGALRDVPRILKTVAPRIILPDIYVRLLARISINNHDEIVGAYSFAVQR